MQDEKCKFNEFCNDYGTCEECVEERSNDVIYICIRNPNETRRSSIVFPLYFKNIGDATKMCDSLNMSNATDNWTVLPVMEGHME